MCFWERKDGDSGLRSILDGEMFARRDQTVKMAVGAQIGFLHRSAQAEKVRDDSLGELNVKSERRQAWKYSIASDESNAGKRSEESGVVGGGERCRSRDNSPTLLSLLFPIDNSIAMC
jgi:hypothetical protein